MNAPLSLVLNVRYTARAAQQLRNLPVMREEQAMARNTRAMTMTVVVPAFKPVASTLLELRDSSAGGLLATARKHRGAASCRTAAPMQCESRRWRHRPDRKDCKRWRIPISFWACPGRTFGTSPEACKALF